MNNRVTITRIRKIDSISCENVFDPIVIPINKPAIAIIQKIAGIASDIYSGKAATAIRATPMNRIMRDSVIIFPLSQLPFGNASLSVHSYVKLSVCPGLLILTRQEILFSA